MKAPGYKAIVLNTYPGKGMPLMEQLFGRGFRMLDFHHARGSFPGDPVDGKGEPVQTEIETVTCVVEEKAADEAFALVHELAKVGEPEGGFMYMRSLDAATAMLLPEGGQAAGGEQAPS